MLDNIELAASAPLSLNSLLANLAIGTGLSLMLRWHFQRFGSAVTGRNQFSQVFILITLTTTLIITIVKASLALSLGLVGALSIVRFRTPIKEPEELAYLFMTIAIGLGLGADQTIPTVLSTVFILALLTLIRWRKVSAPVRSLYLSIDWQQLGEDVLSAEQRLERLNAVVGKHASNSDIRRFDIRNQTGEVIYFLDVQENTTLSSLVGELKSEFPDIGVTFIDQNPALAT